LFSFIGEHKVGAYLLPVIIDTRVMYLRFGAVPPEVAD